MLLPKKVKYRKQQRGRMCGKAWRGSDISFGDYGFSEAHTTYGIIGVKTWVYRGDIYEQKKRRDQGSSTTATAGAFTA